MQISKESFSLAGSAILQIVIFFLAGKWSASIFCIDCPSARSPLDTKFELLQITSCLCTAPLYDGFQYQMEDLL